MRYSSSRSLNPDTPWPKRANLLSTDSSCNPLRKNSLSVFRIGLSVTIVPSGKGKSYLGRSSGMTMCMVLGQLKPKVIPGSAFGRG